ncbi:MAG: SOS response-associated peptidase family protein [Chloroflexi bacterium]|nr:SOS response-associated peptidase family protein [Chloroflexota bacterium]
MLGGDEPLGFAGLCETWRSQEEELVHSFTIIATTPSKLTVPIHNRMPEILPNEAEALWLNQDADPAVLKGLPVPYTNHRATQLTPGRTAGARQITKPADQSGSQQEAGTPPLS